MKKPLQVFNFSVVNRGNKTVDINIDGEIVDASTQAILQAYFGDTTSTSYRSFRNAIDKEDADVYNVIINSPGGVVTDAMAMHDFLVDLVKKGKTVNTIGRGLIASSATLILLAGPKPEMSANSMFMIHTVSGGIWGTVDQIENYSIAMRKFNNLIVDLYANKTGLTKDVLNEMMVKETWLTASEAESQKFIWKKTDNAEFSNIISPEDWPFQNVGILNTYNSLVKKEDNDMKKLFIDLKNDLMNAIKGVKPNADHAELMASLATAISGSFDKMEGSMETEMSTAITAKATELTAAFEARIKILEAVKPVDISNLVTTEALEAEVLAIKGTKSGAKIVDEVKPIGAFNK